MFTGIVEAIGRVRAAEARGDAARLVVEAPFGAELATGESVAVNGCCLTALPGGDGALVADLSPETLRRTTLGRLKPETRVNLERAMRADARLSGHVVQGHVDGMTRLLSSVPEGGGTRQRWSLPDEHARFAAPKGSLAIDGVSLTIAALGADWFEVALIPHTLAVTTLCDRAAGDLANLELDIAGKQAARALEWAAARAPWGRPWVERLMAGPGEPREGTCRAVRAGWSIRVAGCLPVDASGAVQAPGDARAQAERAAGLALEAVSRLGGPDAVIVGLRLFVTDSARRPDLDAALARAFGARPPALTVVEVSRLSADGALVEMEAEACIPPAAREPETGQPETGQPGAGEPGTR